MKKLWAVARAQTYWAIACGTVGALGSCGFRLRPGRLVGWAAAGAGAVLLASECAIMAGSRDRSGNRRIGIDQGDEQSA
jgi:hypothetical protein